jgi:hypothetical protein
MLVSHMFMYLIKLSLETELALGERLLKSGRIVVLSSLGSSSPKNNIQPVAGYSRNNSQCLVRYSSWTLGTKMEALHSINMSQITHPVT